MTHLWEELTSAQLADRLAANPDCVALIPSARPNNTARTCQ